MTPSWDTLVHELKAIEMWDNFFYARASHEKMALVAFQSRQSRRREILELLTRIKGEHGNSPLRLVVDEETRS